MGGIEWDDQNIAHVTRHEVTPSEVEEAFAGRYVVESSPFSAEPRFIAYGLTARGRYVAVVYTFRKTRLRPVTAYPMNRSTRKRYATQINPAG